MRKRRRRNARTEKVICVHATFRTQVNETSRSLRKNLSANFKRWDHGAAEFRFSFAATLAVNSIMKRITLSILCLSALTFSVLAADKPEASPAADNTGKNDRDRSGETKTSGDQSNSPEDIKMTAAIRRAVVADDSLGMMAKNVKIITADGMVTLRGPVNTAAEKMTIEKLAKGEAGKAKIANQLEVKASK